MSSAEKMADYISRYRALCAFTASCGQCERSDVNPDSAQLAWFNALKAVGAHSSKRRVVTVQPPLDTSQVKQWGSDPAQQYVLAAMVGAEYYLDAPPTEKERVKMCEACYDASLDSFRSRRPPSRELEGMKPETWLMMVRTAPARSHARARSRTTARPATRAAPPPRRRCS